MKLINNSELYTLVYNFLIKKKVYITDNLNIKNSKMYSYIFKTIKLKTNSKKTIKINDNNNIFAKITNYINLTNSKNNNLINFDLNKSIKCLIEASSFIKKISKNQGKILFICTETNNNINQLILEYAKKSNSYYITNKWLNGLLTNWNTTNNLILKLKELETITYNLLSKKNKIKLNYLTNLFSGIKNLNTLPDLIIFTHQSKDLLAIFEAIKVGIPIISLVDMSSNPNIIKYPIPCNLKNKNSIEFVLKYLTNNITQNLN